MKSDSNDGGGTTYTLTQEDTLDQIPETHADVVGAEIRRAFADPRQYFGAIAERTQLPGFRRYLQEMVKDGTWSLIIADTYMLERDVIAAFQWIHPTHRVLPAHSGSLITPGRDIESSAGFSGLFDHVQWVHWGGIAWSGGLVRPSCHISLQEHGIESHDSVFATDTTRVFGDSTCGDVMVYNTEGVAGYLSHENGRAYPIGSIPEMLDWIFAELMAGQMPELDYDRLRARYRWFGT